MSQYRATSTKDIKEAYEKNIGFYVPGYGHVGNFKDFYDNELAGEISLNALAEGARTDPKFVEKLDSLRNRTIKDYFANGGSVQSNKKVEEDQEQTLVRTDRQTKSGRTIYKLNGEDVSELTVTFQNKDGKWVNAPSLNFGKIYSEDDVKKLYSSVGDVIDLETGRTLPKYDNVEDAVKAAKKQSESLGYDQTKSSFSEKFNKYETVVKVDAQNLINDYKILEQEEKKVKPNAYGSFKETFAAERRKAIKDGTLDTHTFEYTDLKTGKTNLYHARTVKEQADWLKKRREENA